MPFQIKQKIFTLFRPLRALASPHATLDLKDQINRLEPITEKQVAEVRSFFPLDKFFIFGHARSGTTMLVRLIRLHPQVHCDYQAHFFTRTPFLQSLVADPQIHEWLTRRSNRWNHGQDLSPLVLRVTADFILERDARKAGKSIVGDKSPNNLVHDLAVHLMKRVYPDGRLIFIVRDGRDAILSHRIQAFIDHLERIPDEDARICAEFVRKPEVFLTGKRSLFTEKGLRVEAENWVKNVQETDKAGISLFGDRYISLRYEDIIEQPWEQISRLWQFLNTDDRAIDLAGLQSIVKAEMDRNPDAEYQQQKAGEIAQSVQKGKRGTWRDVLTERDKRIIHEVAGEALVNWGYPLE